MSGPFVKDLVTAVYSYSVDAASSPPGAGVPDVSPSFVGGTPTHTQAAPDARAQVRRIQVRIVFPFHSVFRIVRGIEKSMELGEKPVTIGNGRQTSNS